jgi:hypothetical protein
MFDFKKPEDGSEERYEQRKRVWQGLEPFDPETISSTPNPDKPDINPHNLPAAKHHFWWLLHNLVAHPAIGLFPVKTAFDFHDWTSRKLNGL